ncbi:MAG: hypothetical protein J5859_03650, partial [Clostridia bacterium]|nr:hypothetical protein [Clostridia bacterium]
RMSLAKAKEYPDFRDVWKADAAEPASLHDPDFSGYIAYETEIRSDGGSVLLEIEDVYDCAVLYVNGVRTGERICPPYRFRIRLQPGKNELRIEVATNLQRQYDAMPGFKFSMHPVSAVKKPAGISGRVWLVR